MNLINSDEKWMKAALLLAKVAAQVDEVPVGAIVVHKIGAEEVIVGQGFNCRESTFNPVSHAELLAIQEASKKLRRWRLTDCTLYVTLEPCVMCAGAIVLSRLDRIVYGALDPKAGAIESVFKILSEKKLNHQPEITKGIYKDECSLLLKEFFANKRL
jgi:tRNA(adenine34) deaminase